MEQSSHLLSRKELIELADATLNSDIPSEELLKLSQAITKAAEAKLKANSETPVAWRVWRNATNSWGYKSHPVNGLVCEPLYSDPPLSPLEDPESTPSYLYSWTFQVTDQDQTQTIHGTSSRTSLFSSHEEYITFTEGLKVDLGVKGGVLLSLSLLNPPISS